jgi:hypothetical protein
MNITDVYSKNMYIWRRDGIGKEGTGGREEVMLVMFAIFVMFVMFVIFVMFVNYAMFDSVVALV